MTHPRKCLIATAVLAFLATATGCSDGKATATVEPTTTTPSATPTMTATPTATASPTSSGTASPNAPLDCPETMAVIAATAAVLNETVTESPDVCSYGSSNTSATGSIQSEEWFGAKSLKRYRAAMKSANGKIKGIKAVVKDRPDLGQGAFQLTITGGPSGAITNLVVPRPGGQFASISVSRVKDGTFISDLKLTEGLTRAFLDG